MKFAHIRVSEYFTFAKQIFHSEAISLARRANFVEKSTLARAFFWLGWPDLNRRMPESKSGALPLGDIPIFNYVIISKRERIVKAFFATKNIFCCALLLYSDKPYIGMGRHQRTKKRHDKERHEIGMTICKMSAKARSKIQESGQARACPDLILEPLFRAKFTKNSVKFIIW